LLGCSSTPPHGSRASSTAYNVQQILILALPLIVAAMAQTHAILVGYLDLSVGGMIGLGWSSPRS
jgi:hypothetical protein